MTFTHVTSQRRRVEVSPYRGVRYSGEGVDAVFVEAGHLGQVGHDEASLGLFHRLFRHRPQSFGPVRRDTARRSP
jgi:hypothetical protein